MEFFHFSVLFLKPKCHEPRLVGELTVGKTPFWPGGDHKAKCIIEGESPEETRESLENSDSPSIIL